MAIPDLYSKRQIRLRGEIPDVYRYDELPEKLRVQIVHIWEGVLGNPEAHAHFEPSHVVRTMITNIYGSIVNDLCREWGVFHLTYPDRSRYAKPYEDLRHCFIHETEIEKALYVVEVCFSMMDRIAGKRLYPRQRIAEAREELNRRFQEHAVGYSYANGQIIRKDGEFIHDSIVKPCLRVLAGKEYRGAQEEFLRGHEHYRKGDMKEAMNECVKAFESVMKTICDRRKWRYGDRATAKTLVRVCLGHELIPSLWQDHFTSLQSLLQVGVARNKLSAHGQGTVPVEVPRHLAAFVLHMTAAAIVFLAEAEASGAGK